MARPFSNRRLLAVFPHPDDEAYAAAGLMAMCVAGGAEVSLLCLTRGEGGAARRGSGVEVGAEGLGAARWAELQASCGAVGASLLECPSLPDGALRTRRVESAEVIRAACAEVRPDVVVTLGEDGAYGHWDHHACTAAVAEAVDGPRVLHAAFPPGLFAPVRKGLSRFLGAEGLAPLPAAGLGVPPDAWAVTVELTAAPALEAAKRAALSAHRSQLVGGDPRSFLRRGLVDPLLAREGFVVASGPAMPQRGGADPFAGLR